MPYNYNVIPFRETPELVPSYWFSGYNPNTIRFTFNPTQIPPVSILDAATVGTKINFLISGTSLGYSIGDVIFLLSGANSFYGTIVLIQDFGLTFSISVEFNTTFSAPSATIWRGVRANSYVTFEFIDNVTSLVFATIKRSPTLYGIIDIDFSGALRGQYDNINTFNFDLVNYLEANISKNFLIQYTETDEIPIILPEPYIVVSAGQPTRGNNFNSSNLINYLPDNVTPGKWLHPYGNELNIPIWAGYPFSINFIYPDTYTSLIVNTPTGAIPLDNTQGGGVNHLYLDSTILGGGDGCIDIEGDPVVVAVKELSFNFRYGGLSEFTYQLTEPLKNAAYEPLFSTTLGGTGFYYGLTIPTLTLLSFAAWKVAVNTAPIGAYIKITNSEGWADAPAIITYESTTPNAAPFSVALPFNDTSIGLDFLFPFRFEVQLQGTISGCFAGLRTSSSITEDYGVFPYDISGGAGVTALNAAIAALAEPQSYVVHFWSETHTLKSASFVYTTALRERVKHFSEDKDYQYAYGTDGLASLYNGINQYNYINGGGFPQSSVDRGSTFTVLLEFFFNPQADSLIFTTSTWNTIPFVGFRIDLIGSTFSLGWQTGPGATLDLIRADNFLLSNGYNTVIAQFTGDPLTGCKMWLNKRLANNLIIFNNNVGLWSISNGQDDAGVAAYSISAGASNFFQGMVKQCQFIDRLLTTDEREKSFNARSMIGIVDVADFFFNPEMGAQPLLPVVGYPAFTSINGGGVTTPIYLP